MAAFVNRSFRVVSYAEGISFLLLLFIAMPLKYFADFTAPVAMVGMVHGALFGLYLMWIVAMAALHRWRAARILGAALAAVLPFGPFVFDHRIRRTATTAL